MYQAYIRDHPKELFPDTKIRPFVLKNGKLSETTQLVPRDRQCASPRATSPGYDAAAPFSRLSSPRLRTLLFTEYIENAHEKERRFRE